MSGSRFISVPRTAEPWLTDSLCMTEPLLAATASLSASDFGFEVTQLFGITYVVIEGWAPNTGLIFSGPMPPEVIRGLR